MKNVGLFSKNVGDFLKNVGLFPKNVGRFFQKRGSFFLDSPTFLSTLSLALVLKHKKGRVFSLLEENSAFNLFLHLAVFRVQ